MKKCTARILAIIMTICLLQVPVFAEEGPALSASPILKHALSLLEEGNPFLARYGEITGDVTEAVMPQGIPYLWGGQVASHVFAMAPEYCLQQAWTSSPGGYYKEGTVYFYGFDCYGYAAWVWQQAYGRAMPSLNDIYADTAHHILDRPEDMPASFDQLSLLLQPGDVLVMDHPGRHVAFYIGTLRMYGYTEEDIPELKGHLDDPLVIHSTENAQVADRFDDLIKNGPHKYCIAQPSDGGVHVSLLCPNTDLFTNSVFQQKTTTRYIVLPDGTWLTPLSWSAVARFCFWRSPN